MTEKKRKSIAKEYVRELEKRAERGEQRKNWVPKWLSRMKISRRSLYNYLHKVAQTKASAKM